MLPTNPRFSGGQIQRTPRSSGLRRAQSKTFYRFPEEFLFDSDLDFNLVDIKFPSLSDDNISGSSSTTAPAISADSGGRMEHSTMQPLARTSVGGAHLRSLLVDAAFFEGDGVPRSWRCWWCKRGEETAASLEYVKKVMVADKLADLALMDPDLPTQGVNNYDEWTLDLR